LNSKPRSFPDFSFEIHFESEEVPMEKVVPFYKPFIIIFYFKFVELGKVLFGPAKVWEGFEFQLNFI
jgi:hypothetical protein